MDGNLELVLLAVVGDGLVDLGVAVSGRKMPQNKLLDTALGDGGDDVFEVAMLVAAILDGLVAREKRGLVDKQLGLVPVVEILARRVAAVPKNQGLDLLLNFAFGQAAEDLRGLADVLFFELGLDLYDLETQAFIDVLGAGVVVVADGLDVDIFANPDFVGGANFLPFCLLDLLIEVAREGAQMLKGAAIAGIINLGRAGAGVELVELKEAREVVAVGVRDENVFDFAAFLEEGRG